MTESRRPKDVETHIGNHKLDPSTLMMGYGFDPALSEGSLKPPIFLTSTFVFERRPRASDFSKASPASGPARERPKAWSIRASTAPTRKFSRTG